MQAVDACAAVSEDSGSSDDDCEDKNAVGDDGMEKDGHSIVCGSKQASSSSSSSIIIAHQPEILIIPDDDVEHDLSTSHALADGIDLDLTSNEHHLDHPNILTGLTSISSFSLPPKTPKESLSRGGHRTLQRIDSWEGGGVEVLPPRTPAASVVIKGDV